MNFSKKFRVGSPLQLKRVDPAFTAGFTKKEAEKRIQRNLEHLFEKQYLLYAENKRSLLIVLQGMDAAGKDGVIRHVMRGLNPQGCTVTPFKIPSTLEREHDFLWRIHQAVPATGDISIFNRSHYEDIVTVRVKKLVSKHIWKARYDHINAFERMLNDADTVIVKFFLHISKDEQKERLEKRLRDPQRNWKFNENDLKERTHWDDYMEAYEDALNKCSTKTAPWYIIPADKKWFRNLAVSEILIETLNELKLKLPEPTLDPSSFVQLRTNFAGQADNH